MSKWVIARIIKLTVQNSSANFIFKEIICIIKSMTGKRYVMFTDLRGAF